MSSTTDERGVSSIVGYILLIGLAFTGAFIVVAVGGQALDDVSTETETAAATDSLLAASGRISEISGASLKRSTSFRISNSYEGQVGVDSDATTLEIRVEAVDGSLAVTETRSLGTVYYEQDGELLALQAGGVWKQTENRSRMLSPPEITYTEDRLAISLTNFTDRGTLSNGEIVATHDAGASEAATAQLRNSLATVWSDPGTSKVNVTLTIRSQFADAWTSYARENIDGEVSVDRTGEQTVELTFHELPADAGSTPLSLATRTTTSARPSAESPAGPVSSRATPSPGGGVNPAASDSGMSYTDTEQPTRNRSADGDGDGVVDRYDDCPATPANGSNGCPIIETAGGVTVNSDAVNVTYLGAQLGTASHQERIRNRRDPLDVMFVLDESYSMREQGSFITDREHFSNREYTVPPDEYWVVDPIYAPGSTGGERYRSGETVLLSEDSVVAVYGYEGSDPTGKRFTATKSFIESLNATKGDRAGFVQFYSLVADTHRLTSNFTAIEQELTHDIESGTDIAVGIDRAIEEYDESGNDRVMVVLSDGEDQQGADPIDAAARAAAQNITIYTVGLGDDVVESELRAIANRTGGQYYFVANASGLRPVFEEIANETTTQSSRRIDHQPFGMNVTLGDTPWSATGANLNRPPVRPRSETFDITPGVPLDLTTTFYDCRGNYTASTVTTTNASGQEYVHRGCEIDPDGPTTTHSDYDVYTGGESLPTQNLAWWQRSIPSLLGANDTDERTLTIGDDRALLRVGNRSGYALVEIEATEIIQPPVAELATNDSTVFTGETVWLNASNSTAPGAGTLSYHWSATVTGPDNETATTTFDTEGTRTVSVTVESESGLTDTATIPIEVTDRDPVANLSVTDATPQVGRVLTLDGSASFDPDSGDEIVEYKFNSGEWQSEPTTTISVTTAAKRQLRLTVRNDDGETASTTLVIDPQSSPSATLDAEHAAVYEGERTTLRLSTADTVEDWLINGTSQGTTARTLTRSWTDQRGNATKNVTAIVSKPGTPVTATPTVNVSVENRVPVANLTATPTASERAVELDASESYDLDENDNRTLSHRFRLVEEPSGSTASVTDPTPADGTATVENLYTPGAYRIELTVTDNNGATATVPLRISVAADTEPVELTVTQITTANT